MAANDKLPGKLSNELNPPLSEVVKLLDVSQGRYFFGGGGGQPPFFSGIMQSIV